MKFLLNYIIYLLFRGAVGCISLLPFRIMYVISDGLSFLLSDLIKYRREVIEKNLRRCLPEKSEQEIKKLRKTFTSHLADLFLEGLKGFSLSEQQLKSRYRVKNPELLNEWFSKGTSVLLAGSHYNNWEWGVLIFNRQLDHQVSGIYQIVKNPFIHKYLMKRRSRWGMNLISARNAIPNILAYPGNHAIMILSDQSPSNMNRAIWTTFLGTPTPCLHGLEVMAHKTGFPVVYYEVKKIKRGYYEVLLESLAANPAECASNEITIRYMNRLEQTICTQPEYWLWSHRRWKKAKI